MLVTSADDPTQEIDFLEQSNGIAHDIFSKGFITRSTIERTVKIIQGYLETLAELGHTSTENIRLVATNIISEASNLDILINRIQISCGIRIALLDDGEMTRLIYLKTRRRLKDTPAMQKRNSLVIHLGPGNTRVLQFTKGRIERYSSYRLGTHRSAKAVDSLHAHGNNLIQLLRSHCGGQIAALVEEYQNELIEEIVVIGYEIQLLANYLLTKHANKVSVDVLRNLGQELADLDADALVKRYPFDYQSAEAALPAIEVNLAIAEAFGLNYIRIPGSDYEKGLLQDILTSGESLESFEQEVIRSAYELGKKFRVHLQHAEQVSTLSLAIYDQLESLHYLSKHDRLLLHTAAILHESGGFIAAKAHHKHSQYLIKHSEIFGLSQSDITVVALIARYHRNSAPKPSHSDYRDLPPEDRMRVSKLAAILRVADALDRTHSRRVKDLEVTLKQRKLLIKLPGIHDASVERLAMRSKGSLLQDIFGLEINLIEDSSN